MTVVSHNWAHTTEALKVRYGRIAEKRVKSPDRTILAEHRATDRCEIRRLSLQQRTLEILISAVGRIAEARQSA